MNSPIYPMTFIPKKRNFKLYYLAFPKPWKELLIQLQVSAYKNYNPEYNMKLFGLKACLNGWLDEVVNVGNMKANSDDSRWFVSLNEPDVQKICEIMKIWVTAEYELNDKATSETKAIAGKFKSEIGPDVLRYGMISEEVCLFNEDGTAAVDYAFDAFALYAANSLIGKTIPLFGQELTFGSYGLKKLVSQPIVYDKQYYSYGLEFSVQTTPPQRECMLLVFPSVKRFVSNAWKEKIYLKENINALVKMSENKYRVMKMKQKQKNIDKEKTEYFREWNYADERCYGIYHSMDAFPAADEVLKNPENHVGKNAVPQILLPYKFGMDFTDMNIGTGVSVKEKCEFYHQLTPLLKDIAEPMGGVNSVRAIHYNRPDKKQFEVADIQKMRRERLKVCTGRDKITIEIYGHDSDEPLKNAIAEDICDYFGEADSSDVKIEIEKRSIGSFGDMMNGKSFEDHLLRIKRVQESVEKSAEIKGAIVILKNTSEEKGDPKAALRAGFADTNRLTQFIVPDVLDEKAKDKPSKSRIHGAVLDIFRQFGYTEFADNRNTVKNPACAADVIGVYAYQTLRPLWAAESKSPALTAKILPAYVTFNARSGQVKVECGLFDESRLSYPEALIAFSKLSRKDDFVDKCNKAARGGFVTKLLGLRAIYHDNDGLVLVPANGVTRSLWHGISDTSISGYNMKKPFVPEKIKIGNSFSERTEAFTDSHLRIIRLREGVSTLEVPDYYTEINAKGEFTQSAGVYRRKDVFWGIESRPGNIEYKRSYKKCRADNPKLNFDECALMEYYPLRLREEDDPKQWVGYANLLRELMPENPSRQSVRLPAPLHLAKLMSEYFLLCGKER